MMVAIAILRALITILLGLIVGSCVGNFMVKRDNTFITILIFAIVALALNIISACL